MTDMDYILKELNRIANALERIAYAWEKSSNQPVGNAESAAESCFKKLSTLGIV